MIHTVKGFGIVNSKNQQYRISGWTSTATHMGLLVSQSLYTHSSLYCTHPEKSFPIQKAFSLLTKTPKRRDHYVCNVSTYIKVSIYCHDLWRFLLYLWAHKLAWHRVMDADRKHKIPEQSWRTQYQQPKCWHISASYLKPTSHGTTGKGPGASCNSQLVMLK